MKTYIEEYYTKIINEEIIACRRIKQVYEMLLNNLYSNNKYVFDLERANRPIEFIEKYCRQSQGKIGAPIRLELFQKAKMQAIFGFIDKETRLRQYREVLDIRGRKNGKTTELAATELYMGVGDGEGAPEIYNVATKAEQAMKCYNECHNMIKQSPELRKVYRKRKGDLYIDFNLGFIKALSKNTDGLDGLNASMGTIDELGAIKNRDIYDLVKQSMGAREQPLLNCISTNGFVRNSIFDSQYEYACKVLDGKIEDEHFLPFIYELDNKEEWDNEEMWIKANPGLGTIKKYDFLRDCVKKAKNDLQFKKTVMVKDFNMKETATGAWLEYEDLNNETLFNVDEMGFNYGVGGFDLAETTDLAAAKVLCMRANDPNIYVLSMYWIPEEKILREEENTEDDQVPYRIWEEMGLLRVCPGNRINKNDILDWFIEISEKYDIYINWIGYDPWHVDDTLLQKFKDNFGQDSMIVVRQGVFTLSAPMKELKALLQTNNIIYNNNPIDKWCLSNLQVKTDINNNIQPIKAANRLKIDGGVALIIAYVILLNKMAELQSLI